MKCAEKHAFASESTDPVLPIVCIRCAGEFYERYKAAIDTGILLPDSQQASCAKQLSALGDQLAAYTRALAFHRSELASYQVRVLCLKGVFSVVSRYARRYDLATLNLTLVCRKSGSRDARSSKLRNSVRCDP